jgi:hypothetical protein
LKTEKKDEKEDSDSPVDNWDDEDIDKIVSKVKVNKDQI